MPPAAPIDRLGRPLRDLRISVTDRCNFRCPYCMPEEIYGESYRFLPKPQILTFEEIHRLARLFVESGVEKIRITGGEPLLQAPALAKLMDLLPDISVEIETNGTTKAPPPLDIRIDQFNVSPKLAHSGNPAELALLPERLDAYATDPRAWFKFVIAEPSDVDEVLALRDRYRFRPGHVFLMPEGTDSETLRAREKWLAGLCVEHGFRMSDRLHIHLFGDTRGT